MRIWPGTPYPLGATWDGWGTNFTLFSEVAERVELCLFDEADDGSGTLTRPGSS
jgi:Type II secretory pathway, pullulanase PulA and related glycosidases